MKNVFVDYSVGSVSTIEGQVGRIIIDCVEFGQGNINGDWEEILECSGGELTDEFTEFYGVKEEVKDEFEMWPSLFSISTNVNGENKIFNFEKRGTFGWVLL